MDSGCHALSPPIDGLRLGTAVVAPIDSLRCPDGQRSSRVLRQSTARIALMDRVVPLCPPIDSLGRPDGQAGAWKNIASVRRLDKSTLSERSPRWNLSNPPSPPIGIRGRSDGQRSSRPIHQSTDGVVLMDNGRPTLPTN
ncbi:hypothetical protein chiPu_0018278 [Chiloscyllium punctatum]|uniref:Uncharacterized protein n=1 Tax=Chiloscyllium punctatum TaxID=137246 RepID=A0A401RM42_CHIPU|nr:hypothetical protein [Chiloscyllium punctatum]